VRAATGIALAALILAAAPAAAEKYMCSFTGRTVQSGALPPKVEVHLAADGSAQVLDGFILELKGGPIAARRTPAAKGQSLLTWSLEIPHDGHVLRVDFRLWLSPGGGPAAITAEVLRYRPVNNAKGSCKLTGA
jgi:hypothetical protein